MPDPTSLATEVEEPPASFCRIGRSITSAKCSSKTAATWITFSWFSLKKERKKEGGDWLRIIIPFCSIAKRRSIFIRTNRFCRMLQKLEKDSRGQRNPWYTFPLCTERSIRSPLSPFAMWAHARGTREHASAPTRRVSRIPQSNRDTRLWYAEEDFLMLRVIFQTVLESVLLRRVSSFFHGRLWQISVSRDFSRTGWRHFFRSMYVGPWKSILRQVNGSSFLGIVSSDANVLSSKGEMPRPSEDYE